MKITRTRFTLAAAATVAALALAGCASGGDPLEGGDAGGGESGDSSTIVIGSQSYYSNEIIAEIYAQALEAEGFEVERQFNIGQRDAYIPSLEDGSVDLFPEYTGATLSYLDKNAEASSPEDVARKAAMAPAATSTSQFSWPCSAAGR